MPFEEKRGNLMYITIIYDNFYGLDMGNCGNVKCWTDPEFQDVNQAQIINWSISIAEIDLKQPWFSGFSHRKMTFPYLADFQ